MSDWREVLGRALSPDPPADGAHHSLPDHKRYLWLGAKLVIQDWQDNGGSARDADASEVYIAVIQVLGMPRKGDASKISLIARVSVLFPEFTFYYGSLSEAYRNAKRIQAMPDQ